MTAGSVFIVAVLILVGLWALRGIRVYLFMKELFWELDPIIEADKWEGYKRDRQRAWTARRKKGGEVTFMPTRHGASMVVKYLRLQVRPWFVPWPQREHIAEVTVRIPPRTNLHAVRGRLVEAVARYLNVAEGNLHVQEYRRLLLGKLVRLAVL
jgi:hypothetical protein